MMLSLVVVNNIPEDKAFAWACKCKRWMETVIRK